MALAGGLQLPEDVGHQHGPPQPHRQLSPEPAQRQSRAAQPQHPGELAPPASLGLGFPQSPTSNRNDLNPLSRPGTSIPCDSFQERSCRKLPKHWIPYIRFKSLWNSAYINKTCLMEPKPVRISLLKDIVRKSRG